MTHSSRKPETYDVIVVGFGAAGAAAAIEAADRGATVLVLDRTYGGGASALSGGIVYAGGGTAQQRAAGYRDTVDNLFAYLKKEAGDAVDEATLRDFCEQSPGIIPWLEKQGAEFGHSVAPYKTSYPTDDYYLYFSGNEKVYPYNVDTEPAPRGHRVLAKRLDSGKVLMARLMESALRKGVTFVPLAQVTDLVTTDGKVTGVTYRVLDGSDPRAEQHRRLTTATGKIGNFSPALVDRYVKKAERLWEEGAVTRTATAPSVILSAGGFAYNEEWLEKYAPEFTGISPLGTPADDGSGIALGMEAGAATSHMNQVTAWRFLAPPSAFVEGVTVGLNGRRITNEDLYGATHGNVMMREFGGKGWAVFDSNHWRKALKQFWTQTQVFHKLQLAFILSPLGHVTAATLEELAAKMNVDPNGLRKTVEAYNRGISSGEGDPAHKDPELCSPVLKPPFRAYNISDDSSPFLPVPGLTLGGLVVEGSTGMVKRGDGSVIDGLYAAGRNAVGICSNSYISGLSIADCLYSGRRAGAHAALRVAIKSEG